MRWLTQDDRCSLGLSAVGWSTQHQLGSASRVPLGPVDEVYKLGDVTPSRVIRAGA